MMGKRQALPAAACAAALALLLGACSERADVNPNAPGSPGTGNSAEVVKPAVPDSPPGGPSGITGSLPHSGSSGGDMWPGSTGSGAPQGASQSTATPGVGLDGGLGSGAGLVSGAPQGMPSTPVTGTTSAPTGAALSGSPNVMGGVGQR